MRRRTVDARRRPVVVSVRHPVGSRTPDHRFGWWDAVCAGRVAARRWERAAWAGDRWIDGLTRRGCASGGSFLWVVRARSRVTRRGCACRGSFLVVRARSRVTRRGCACRGSFLVVRARSRVTRRGCACRGSFLVVRARSRVTRRGCACPAPLGWGVGLRWLTRRGCASGAVPSLSAGCRARVTRRGCACRTSSLCAALTCCDGSHQARLRMSGSSPAPRSSTGDGHQARLRISAPFGLGLSAGCRVFTRRDCASGPPPRSAASARRGRRYRGHGHAQQSVQPLRRPLPAVTPACARRPTGDQWSERGVVVALVTAGNDNPLGRVRLDSCGIPAGPTSPTQWARHPE
jgi:hypothetical protein